MALKGYGMMKSVNRLLRKFWLLYSHTTKARLIFLYIRLNISNRLNVLLHQVILKMKNFQYKGIFHLNMEE